MGKVKILIVAAIVLLVQTGLSRGLAVAEKPARMASVLADEDCDWPMFGRTPDGNRVAPDGCGPMTDKLKISWVLDQKIHNTPIVANRFIYFSTSGQERFCADISNGTLKWISQVGFCGSGVYYDGKIISGNSVSALFCLDATDGKFVWKKELFNRNYGVFCSNPCLIDDKIYFPTEQLGFYCCDANSGNVVWKNEEKKIDGFNDTPVAWTNTIIIGSNKNGIYCFNKETGTLINLIPILGITSNILLEDNRIYFTTSSASYCYDLVYKKIVWQNNCKQVLRNYSTPIIKQDRLIISNQGSLICINKDDGKIFWEYGLGSTNNISMAVCGEKLYSVSRDGTFFVNDIVTGNVIFSKKLGKENFNFTSPVIAYGSVFVVVDGKLYCFEDEQRISNIIIESVEKRIDLCNKVQLSARLVDQYGKEIDTLNPEWSVEPAGIGTIDATGLFTPSKTGVAKITCRCGDVEATVDINVVDFLVPSVKTLVLTNVKPYQNYKSTLTYTNNSDSRLDVKLIPSTDLISLEPSSFSVDAGKSFDVLVSCRLKEFVPSAVTSFTINADYGGCPDILHGTIMNADKYSCFMVSPEMLDFGLVKRGDSKTLALKIESNAKQTLTINCDQPWVEISKKSLPVDVGQKETIDFKIMASSLPASSKLKANITIISDLNFCEQTTIPLLVSTEDSITINLQVDSKIATINGQERMLDVPARIIGGRTMVPLRFISESFGCSIQWDPTTQKIGIIRYDITVNLWIGKDYVEVNGNRLKIDAPPVIVGGRTMVPLRFIAEPFGAKVDWNAQTKGITITWPKL